MTESDLFRNLIDALINKNPADRTAYLQCLAHLPTIKQDLPALFNYINMAFSNENSSLRYEKFLIILFEVFNLKPPASLNYSCEELLFIFQKMLLITQPLSSLSVYLQFMNCIQMIMVSFPKGTDPNIVINAIRSSERTIHTQLAYVAFCKFHERAIPEALSVLVNTNFSDVVSLFSFGYILKIVKKSTNFPAEYRNYIEVNNLIQSLSDFLNTNYRKKEYFQNQKCYANASNDQINSLVKEKNNTINEFVVYFILQIQDFYDPFNVLIIDKQFFNSCIMSIINMSDFDRQLVSELMVNMPSTNDNDNLKIGNQISALLVTLSMYCKDYDSVFMKNIVSFAVKRKDDPIFVDTLLKMPGEQTRYPSAIYIGSETNLFANQNFVVACFPAVPKPELYNCICKAIPFLAKKNFVSELSVRTVLTSVFSMLCNPVIQTNIETKKLIAEALLSLTTFSDHICQMTIEHFHKIVSFSTLGGIINLILNNRKSFVFQPSSVVINDYLRCVSVVAHLICAKRENDNEKIIFMKFLSFIKGEDVDDINNLPNCTVISVVDHYIEPKNMNMFCAIALDMFSSDESYSVVIAALPNIVSDVLKGIYLKIDNIYGNKSQKKNNSNNNNKDKNSKKNRTKEQEQLDFNEELRTRRQFVNFYKVRIQVDPTNTIDHLFHLLGEAKKKNSIMFFKGEPSKRFLHAMIRLLTVFCRMNSVFRRQSNNNENNSNNLAERIGELIQETLPTNEDTLFVLQTCVKKLIFESSKNTDAVELPVDFAKKLICYPMYSDSIPYLLKRIPRNQTDAIVAAKARAQHLIKHHAARFSNDEIASSIVYASNSPDELTEAFFLSKIILNILPEIDTGELSVIDLAHSLVKACLKKNNKNTASVYSEEPLILLNFSKLCFSNIEEIRVLSYRFILDYYGVTLSTYDENDFLNYFDKKQSKADRIALFLDLFRSVFSLHPNLGVLIFKAIAKKSSILSNLKSDGQLKTYHILLCRAIVESGCTIPEDVLYEFTKLGFVSPNSIFEAQLVLKNLAIKNMPNFVNFLLNTNLTDFTSTVIRRISFSTDLRTSLIDSFLNILSKSDTITSQQLKLLKFIVTSENSGELNSLCLGKLLLLTVMLLGISFGCGKSVKELNSIFPYFVTNKSARSITFDINSYSSFDLTLEKFCVELEKIPFSQLNEFCKGCFECVKIGNEMVITAVGVLFIHLSRSFSSFDSLTARKIKANLWDTVSKSFNRSGDKNKRFLSYVLNRVLTKPNIESISAISKNHIFNSALKSLSAELDDFRKDTVDIVCIFLPYVKSKSDMSIAFDINELITNLQRSLCITPKNSNSSNNNNNNFNNGKNIDFRLNANVLEALNLLAAENVTNFFGDPKKTILNSIDIAMLFVKGNNHEQQLSFELFMKLFKKENNEDVVKCLEKRLTDDDFKEYCSRMAQVSVNEIDEHWMQILLWIGESIRFSDKAIVPELKKKLFDLSLKVLDTNGHKCHQLALKGIDVFL